MISAQIWRDEVVPGDWRKQLSFLYTRRATVLCVITIGIGAVGTVGAAAPTNNWKGKHCPHKLKL